MIPSPIKLKKEINLQKAIDMAVREKTIVSFPCSKSNEEIRESEKLLDLKSCGFYKKTKESSMVEVCLKSIMNEILS